jgi:hypothetical protein
MHFPAPNDTDWQVARFEHQRAVNTGQRQQFVASALRDTAASRSASPTIRQQIATLLVRAGQSLQGSRTMAKESLGVVA